MWNGLYLKEVIEENQIRFDESFKFGVEEFAFNLTFLGAVKEVTLVSDELYQHFIRIGQSTGAGFRVDRLNDIVRAAGIEKDFLEQQGTFSEKNWAAHQAKFVLMYLRDLNKPGSNLSNKEVVEQLRALSYSDVIKLHCRKCFCLTTITVSLRSFIISVLFNLKWYGVLQDSYVVLRSIKFIH